MYEIEMQEMREDFFECWKAAAKHLNKQVDVGIQSWLRGHPFPPFLEHLSFRLGNQLFFVRVVDIDGKVEGPGTMNGLIYAAKSAHGYACLLPMKRERFAGNWVATGPGWSLVAADTGNPINPAALVTEARIEMTHWELQDMAVQVVRDYLENSGFQLMSWQGNPEVDPSIWFVGTSRKPEWVVVRSAKFPSNKAERPGNWEAIANDCAKLSPIGHFASVALVSATQPFKSSAEEPVPLWRGHGMHVRFTGLE